jgi:integrase/recombinase XerD
MTALLPLEDPPSQLLTALFEEAESEPEFEDRRARRERWDRAVDEKLADLSANSRRAYRRENDRWTSFLAAGGREPFEAEVGHARLYARLLVEVEGLAPSSVGRALAALSGVYRDVIEQEPSLVKSNPFASVRRPKATKRAATASLTLEEAREFVAASKTVSPRAYALALLLLSTGLRISEVLAADSRDLRAHAGGQVVLRVERKGGVRAQVAVPHPVAQALEACGRSRAAKGRQLVRRVGGHRIASGPLFTGRSGRMTASESRREFERICRAAGWAMDRVTAHGLRHTFATTAVEACDATVRQVQHALGHASVDTTETYLHDDRFAATVNRAVLDKLLNPISA